jgi:magnesium transporter
MFLMLSATFTSMVINSYESALSSCVVLTGFIPMLMGTGGIRGPKLYRGHPQPFDGRYRA